MLISRLQLLTTGMCCLSGLLTASAVSKTLAADSPAGSDAPALQVGVAEADITPPLGFPMAGYYRERLAEGAIDPLKARAIVFRDDETAAAMVVCDIIGVATDLAREVRKQASEQTGIPASHIIVSATHTHTAPDYMKELFLYLGHENQQPLRAQYIKKLISGPVAAIVEANANARSARLQAGFATQETPVSFNRRFLMRDGSVRTWMKSSNPDVIRPAGPIDPQIGLLTIHDADTGAVRGVFSNFALHLDTVGGSRWSADYPYFIEQKLCSELGDDVISIFGTGCCGDINHSDPDRRERNKVDFIGNSLGETIVAHLEDLAPVTSTKLFAGSRTIHLPLEDASQAEVEHSIALLNLVKNNTKIDFFDHVTAYKKIILDQFLHPEPFANTQEHITWGLSRSLAGIGQSLPVDVSVITIGPDVALVFLPGEVFVDLGLAIKQASPFRTTMIVELSNAVETIYVPHRAAYAGGSYEVTNSTLRPGSGEMLVETSLRMLRDAASEFTAQTK